MAYNAFFVLYFLDGMAWVAFCVFFLIRPPFLAATTGRKTGAAKAGETEEQP